MSKYADKGLLGDIFCKRGVPNDSHRESEQSVLVAANEDETRPIVTDRHSRKQRFVRNVVFVVSAPVSAHLGNTATGRKEINFAAAMVVTLGIRLRRCQFR